ncbi:DUF502 domain-containing protein [Selenomonas sputigena]|uniref:DUF502 domain-containing protein n=1 Tax=Selenomonas sputigena (strain ATCC 35185 / DSM 20758 / CCUG 44933 / VPI D19B-28) TaxID=546271 RepID=C9LT42_SELS3|nr:DUF502 domain-containing protein [Selenomonas sputigena]AEC00520.1 protein of unknown function DUF502 [Selenomonas sputigena ATCC 35185]EEX77888.1 hypothetical protein SELSPUOL_00622 [Selenomonas sputigena ATCC 35185]
MNKVSKRFINGLILLVPLAITVFVVTEVLNFTEIVLGKHFPVYYPGMGIVTVLLVIYLVGWLSSYWFMKRVISYGEWLLGKIPVVKFIYNSVKHLSTAVFESNNMFDHVVLVPFHQSRALGFVMAEVPAVLREKLGDDYVCVFVPWSLNMTSGTNLFVKKSDVIYLDISNESALQYMLTAGAVMPQRQMSTKSQEAGSAMRLADEVVAASKTQSARAAGEACEEAEPHGTPQR